MSQMKSITKSEPTCFTWENPKLGFTFELGGKKQLLAFHSFLSHIELTGGEEICFHYTFSIVRVIGRNLESIYRLIKQHEIGVIRPSNFNDPCRLELKLVRSFLKR